VAVCSGLEILLSLQDYSLRNLIQIMAWHDYLFDRPIPEYRKVPARYRI